MNAFSFPSFSVVSILSPALCVNAVRSRFGNVETVEKVLSTFLAFMIYYLGFCLVYIGSLIISRGILKRAESFSVIFHFNLLFLYASCLLYWVMESSPTCYNNFGKMSSKCYTVISIQVVVAIFSFIFSIIVRDFAQFGLNLMNEKICMNFDKFLCQIKRTNLNILKWNKTNVVYSLFI